MGYREVPFSLASQIPMLVGRHPIPLLGICVQHDGCKLACSSKTCFSSLLQADSMFGENA